MDNDDDKNTENETFTLTPEEHPEEDKPRRGRPPKNKPRRGRPEGSKLDDFLPEIIRRLKMGITPITLAEQCGVTRLTLYNLAKKHNFNMTDLVKEGGKISIKNKIVVIENEMDL